MNNKMTPYTDTSEKLYRYEEHADGDAQVYLTCYEYPIIRKTKCCVFINVYNNLKRVQLQWSDGYKVKKQFACVTKEEALVNYKTRKKYQIKILERKLDMAKLGLEIANSNELTKTIVSPILCNQLLSVRKDFSDYY